MKGPKVCTECGGGFHELCEEGGCGNCHSNKTTEVKPRDEDYLEDSRPPGNRSTRNSRKGRSGVKTDRNLKDQQSTGRKRAAVLFPLVEGAPCEWRGKTNCGGGEHPITGCMFGIQMARHHGPDKNTLHNEVGNVHRICATCHNRWHTLNDPEYQPDGVHKSHEPIEASEDDFIADGEFWFNRHVKVARD